MVVMFLNIVLQHFGNTKPRDDFKKANEDESITHNAILHHSIVCSNRTESLAKRVDNESAIHSNETNDC